MTYEHFKSLLGLCGQEDRLNEVRLAMSHEYFNTLNFVLYQLYAEIHFKQVKHATIFAHCTDSEGFVKKTDFIAALNKCSILSESQLAILLKFYDSLNTELVHGATFIEHLTHKEFVNIATQVTIKNDLIPYYYQIVLSVTEQSRLGKIHESFKEALKQLVQSESKEPTAETTAAKNVNPILSASKEQLQTMIDDWMPGLSASLKSNLIRHISVGERQMPSTSVWQSDGYGSLISKFLQCITIQEYN